MTVKELREALSDMPDNMEVVVVYDGRHGIAWNPEVLGSRDPIDLDRDGDSRSFVIDANN